MILLLTLSALSSALEIDYEEASLESIKAYWEHLKPGDGHDLCRAVGLAFIVALDEDDLGWEGATTKAKEVFMKGSDGEQELQNKGTLP